MDIHAAMLVLASLGVFAGGLLLLEQRDRREEALAEVMWCAAPRDLVSFMVIDVHCALVWPGSVARIHMSGVSRGDIRKAVAHWREVLPPYVRIEVMEEGTNTAQ